MAKNDKQKEKRNNTPVEPMGPQAPEGFVPMSSSGNQNWVELEAGLVIEGRLLGRMRNKNGFFYQIRLGSMIVWPSGMQKGNRKPGSCTRNVRDADGESRQERFSPKRGEVVCLNEKQALEGMQDLTKDGGVYDVWVHVKEKQELDGNRTWWLIDWQRKVVQAPPTRVQTPPAREEPPVDDSDVPF